MEKKSKKKRVNRISETNSIVNEPRMLTEKEIAIEFATKAHRKFDRLIKASILFGSQAKGEAGANSDIDIIFIIDDASINWDLELVSWYREELGKIIELQTKETSPELHINTVKLTTWWNDLLKGDPVVLNILRYGEALIDSGGFFTPLKALMLEGKIKATTEAAYAALQRAPEHLTRSRFSEMSAIEGVYWAMVDSAQAALITAGLLPPSPEKIPMMLKETFSDSGILKISFVENMKNLYLLHKGISHGEITSIHGVDIDRWQDAAEKFVGEMSRIIDGIIEAKRKI